MSTILQIETTVAAPRKNPSSSLSSKGQITLPLEVRQRLGVKPGDRIDFAFEDGRVVVRPLHRENDCFDEYIGALGAFSTRKELLDWTSDLRDDDERIADLRQWDEIKEQADNNPL